MVALAISTRMSPLPVTFDHHCFKQLFELSPDPTWIIDGNQFVECNEAAVRTLGYASREEFLNVHPSRLSPPTQPGGEDSYAKAERMMALARERGLHRFEWIHSKADGTEFLAEVTLSMANIEDHPLIFCVWRDISERRRAEELARDTERQYRLLFEQASDGIFLQSETGFIDCNEQGARMYGLSREQVRGRSPAELSPERQADGRLSALVAEEKIAAAMRLENPRFEWQARRADGSLLDVEISLNRVALHGGVALLAIVRDITERKKFDQHVMQLAFHDNLTQLPNRRLLHDRLNQLMAISQRSGCYSAMLFIDLDNFKPLNDAHGHETGDLLLIEVAARLKSCVREMDTVARFGGDEFVVLLTELDTDRDVSAALTGVLAEKIRVILARPYVLGCRHPDGQHLQVEHHCTASIGVALFSDHVTSQDSIFSWSDLAMYKAKASGRNTVRFHQPPA